MVDSKALAVYPVHTWAWVLEACGQPSDKEGAGVPENGLWGHRGEMRAGPATCTMCESCEHIFVGLFVNYIWFYFLMNALRKGRIILTAVWNQILNPLRKMIRSRSNQILWSKRRSPPAPNCWSDLWSLIIYNPVNEDLNSCFNWCLLFDGERLLLTCGDGADCDIQGMHM